MQENMGSGFSEISHRRRFGLLTNLLGRKIKAASVPPGQRIYAVGDIHGCIELLKKLWATIEEDARGSNLHKIIIFVGDYVDRGMHSRDVIEFLIQTRLEGGEIICLRGNHDQSVLDFIASADYYKAWKPFGAPETLLSYGVMPPRFERLGAFEEAREEFLRKCPPAHIAFFQSLRLSYIAGDYVFVHAGIRPGVPLDAQSEKDLLWIREDFLMSRSALEKVVVHGHTPQERAVRHPQRIGIDTGAYATGRLSAVVLEGGGCRFLST